MHGSTYRQKLFAAFFLLVLSLGSNFVISSPVAAQENTIRPGFDNFILTDCDDCSNATTLGFTINFFGVAYQGVYINSNGNITFNDFLFDFNPTDLTQPTGNAIIAPFFADVDMTPSQVSGDSGFITYGTGLVNGRNAFATTWNDVKHFFAGGAVKRNTFQVVLIETSPASGNFTIEFNYREIWWEAGDFSNGNNGVGGNTARVGFSNGSGQFGSFFELVGSGVPGSFLNTNPNNGGLVGMSGGRLNFTFQGGYPTAVIANADNYSTPYLTPLNGASVLNNDRDNINGTPGNTLQPTAAAVVTPPGNGTLVFNPNGTFVYTPRVGFNGVDFFTYIAYGSSVSNVATVTINVLASTNQPPVAQPNSYSTAYETQLVVNGVNHPSILANDTDPEGKPLTALLVTPPLRGTLNLQSNGHFTYTPNAGYFGTDSFTYQAFDGETFSNIVTVAIQVRQPLLPPTAGIDIYSTAFNTPLVVTASNSLLKNDSDPNGDPLTAVKVTDPLNGTITNFTPQGTFTYTPNPGFSGADRFKYKAFDGLFYSEDTVVSIIVSPTTNVPPVAHPDFYSTPYQTPLVVSAANGVLKNDVDPDNSVLTAFLVTTTLNGTLDFKSDGSFTYTPNQRYSGRDNFSYQAFDGIFRSNVMMVELVVEPQVNVAPVANDDSYVTGYETILFVNTINGVLTNDTDANGDRLRARLESNAQNGFVALEIDGSFSYTPNNGFIGVDRFTYYANDGNLDSNPATVTIRVTEPSNVPPVAGDDAYSTPYLQPLVVNAPGVLANDSDLNGDRLTPIVVDRPLNGTLEMRPDGGFTYSPNAGFNGLDYFTYRASDGLLLSTLAVVRITVGDPNNVAPRAVGDAYSTAYQTTLVVSAEAGVLANDSDENGDVLSARLGAPPSNGSLTLNSDGSFTYRPDPGFSGLDIFTYRASDGTLTSNSAIVRITVRENDSPPLPPPTNLNVRGNLFVPPINLTYTWAHPIEGEESEGVPADLYQLTLTQNGIILFEEVYSASQICEIQFCQVNPQMPFEIVTGRYAWYVTAWSYVNGAASSEEATFEVEILPPDVPIVTSVDTATARPIIIWNDDNKAAWYQVLIESTEMLTPTNDGNNDETGNGEGEVIVAQVPAFQLAIWVSKADISCDGLTCSVVIDNFIPNGLYQVRVQAWGPGGYNLNDPNKWSDRYIFDFTFAPAGPPTALTATNADTGNPTFTWPAAPGASWYYIWVGQRRGNDWITASQRWYTASEAKCTIDQCTLITDNLRHGMWLINGTYQVFITTWGPGGSTGQYLQGPNVVVNAPMPTAPIPLTPSGVITRNRPVFTWDAVPGASLYQVYVERTSASTEPFIYNQWHFAWELGCTTEGDVCRLQTPDLWIQPGNYRWYVRAYGPATRAADPSYIGPWSNEQTFIRRP